MLTLQSGNTVNYEDCRYVFFAKYKSKIIREELRRRHFNIAFLNFLHSSSEYRFF